MEYSIKTENLTKQFGSFKAVDNLNIEVKSGEIFGFLGANGAGKTTAMKMLCGLITPSDGQATVAGFDLLKNPDSIKRHIGYMSQKFSLYDDLTVTENITFFAGIYGLNRKEIRMKEDQLLTRLQMVESKTTLVRSLPLGWKQKLAFSIAIIHSPAIVFLDEPTGGVDPITRRQFWQMIYETAAAGMTVFVTTHYMDEAEYCDRVSIMVDGGISALGTPSELKDRYGVSDMQNVFYQLARTAKRISA